MRQSTFFRKRLEISFLLALLASCGPASLNSGTDMRTEYGIPGVLNPDAGSRIEFHQDAFFSLESPNSSSCAGDVRQYYLPLDANASGSPEAYPFANDEASVKATFLRNVAVDITDASSALPGNQASSCSLTSPTLGASSCATFDSPSISGSSATLGGSLLFIGAQTGADSVAGRVSCGTFDSAPSTAGDLSCSSDFYGLSLERTRTSSATRSSWTRLSRSSSYSGPGNASGGALVVEPTARKLLYFGGYGTSNSSDSSLTGHDLNNTWVYDLERQTWTQVSATFQQDSAITNIPQAELNEPFQTSPFYSVSLATGGNDQQVARLLPPRANFGVASNPLFALKDFAGNLDDTDRVVIYGGVTGIDASLNLVTNQQIYRFNPTFGPDWVDHDGGASGTEFIRQWIDPSPIQIMSNNQKNLQLWADGGYPYGTPGTAPASAYNFRPLAGAGFIDLLQTAGAGYGFLMSFGGNDARFASIDLTNGTYTAADYNNRHGVFRAQTINDPFTGTDINQDRIGVGNYDQDDRFVGTSAALESGSRRSPYRWVGSDPTHAVPKLFGMHALKGFDLANNDVVVFGGINCRDYLSIGLDANCSDGVASSLNTSTLYYRMGTLMAGAQASETAPALPAATAVNPAPNPVALPTNVPALAGMATARGLDNNEQPILVAWGGTHSDLRMLSGVVTTAHRDYLYILVNAGCPNPPNCTTLGTPTWIRISPSSTARPNTMSNASMVFSHVTQKYYLFGGYDRTGTTPVTRGDTWELTIAGCDPGFDAPGISGDYGCTATWRQMNTTSGGLTCAPDCASGPQARRSHRFYEVNYYNKSPTSEYRRSDCTVASPCSFGIFLEGGVSDSGFLSDRWLFDPTAHGGLGHWQRIDDLPARRLAALGSVSYRTYPVREQVSRALLFGGEMGLQNPEAFADPSLYRYLPPILGDTLTYDFTTKKWERVELFGTGVFGNGAVAYDATTGATTSASDSLRDAFERRSTYATDPAGGVTTANAVLARLAPEPRAGAMMVTRTGKFNASNEPEALAHPEIYMVGGRLKNGQFAPLAEVWKFCAGSPRERFNATNSVDDGTCEAYTTLDPLSTAPVKKSSGRWLVKTPSVPAAEAGSYQGAAAYHSGADKIVVVGGKTAAAATTQAYSASLMAAGAVLEYTFPTRSLLPITTNADIVAAPADFYGQWNEIAACAGSTTPTARYGHSLAYDPVKDELLMVGGLSFSGAALTQTYVASGSSTGYSIPEVWAAKRIASPTLCYQWRQITDFSNAVTTDLEPPVNRGLAHAAATYIPPTGYATGYYSLFDQACIKQGTIQDSDPTVNKLYAGGVYIDLERDHLGERENLLLNLTIVPLSQENRAPSGAMLSTDDQAVFRVHLIEADQDVDVLRATNQPRHLAYTSERNYPKVLSSLTILTPQEGSMREEQIVIPLSSFPSADRIRIERESGSAVIVRATVYRMGRR